MAGPGLLRRLRALAADGSSPSTGRCWAPAAGPRYERWVRLTDAGRRGGRGARAAGETLGRAAARPAPGRGARASSPPARRDGASGRDLAGRHGSGGRRRSRAPRPASRPRSASDRGGRWPRRPAGRRGGRPPATRPVRRPRPRRSTGSGGAIAARDPRPLLLDGVTGGGKTAIYVEAIAASLEAGRPALVLVPEIALALPLVDRLRADLDARVALVHSGLGDGERADEWRRIRAGDVDLVVGTRLAVVAPLADVGLIVVDEEHDAAYKSDRTPRLQARDVGDPRWRGWPARRSSSGRRRPPVESVGRARDGDYRPRRAAGAAGGRAAGRRDRRPARGARRRQPRAAVARARRRARRARHGAGRAGDPRPQPARHGVGRRCAGTAATSRPARTASGRSSTTRPARRCAATTAAGRRRSPRAARTADRRGSATSAVARNGSSARSRDRFPGLRVGRLDRDVVERRGAAERVVDAFADGRLDVLVGTSLVTKGLDIPSVTLVGVVSSDVALNLPDERAAERTYQLLVQAIGRAGRGDRPGRAIIQTYQPDHPAIQAAATGDRSAFYDAELALRRRFGSPPFGRLVKLTVGLADRGRRGTRGHGHGRAGSATGAATEARPGHGRRSGAGLHRPTGGPLALERRPARRRSGGAARRRRSTRRGRWTSTRNRCSEPGRSAHARFAGSCDD